MAVGPQYSLDDVKALVAKGEFWLSQKPAIAPIIAVLNCTVSQAKAYAARVIQALAADNYSETVTLNPDLADVYAISVGGDAWYIKFCIDPKGPNGPEVSVISFHPPKHPVRTKAGTVKPGT